MPGMEPAKQSIAPVRSITIDALGTMVELEPPWIHLAAALGVEADERLAGAVRAEMAYYRENSHLGHDPASLAKLRARCAEVLSTGLGRTVEVATMMSAIRFRAFPDAAPALAALRERGLRLVCVSNWDCSLGEVLARCGLAGALDGVVSSAEAGARKPDPKIFAAALALAGSAAEETLHVGDTPSEDVAGAQAAGLRALLIDREGEGDITSLAELPGRVESMCG